MYIDLITILERSERNSVFSSIYYRNPLKYPEHNVLNLTIKYDIYDDSLRDYLIKSDITWLSIAAVIQTTVDY